MVPWGRPMKRPGPPRRPRSRDGPRGGSRAWGDRSRGRCPGSAARGRCDGSTWRSRTGSPAPGGRRPARGPHRDASRGAVRRGWRGARPAGSVALGAGVFQRAAHRVHAARLPGDHVGPGRRQRVLEVGHEDPRARVERVDHHLGLGGTGDLDPPIVEVRAGRGRRSSRAREPRRSRARAPGNSPASKRCWRSAGAAKQTVRARREAPGEMRHQGQRVGRQHPLRSGDRAVARLYALDFGCHESSRFSVGIG